MWQFLLEVVKDFPLNDLAGKEFRAGKSLMRGVELCDPCHRPSKLCGKEGFEESFTGFGGLRAEVVFEDLVKVPKAIGFVGAVSVAMLLA